MPISDTESKKLLQIAMALNKGVLENLAEGKLDLLSTRYTNIMVNVYEYAFGSQTWQMETTAGTLFGACNSVTGYFTLYAVSKVMKLSLNLLWTELPNKRRKPPLIFAVNWQRWEAKR